VAWQRYDRPRLPSILQTRNWRQPKRRLTSRQTKPDTRCCSRTPTGPSSRPWPNPGRLSPPARPC
jgi:hypothetical protein